MCTAKILNRLSILKNQYFNIELILSFCKYNTRVSSQYVSFIPPLINEKGYIEHPSIHISRILRYKTDRTTLKRFTETFIYNKYAIYKIPNTKNHKHLYLSYPILLCHKNRIN